MVFNFIAQVLLKLTASDYFLLSAFLVDYLISICDDMLWICDDILPCLEETIIMNSGIFINPAYHTWVHQHQLILNAIFGSLSSTLISFIATT